MTGRAVVGTMVHTWKALKDRFGPLDGNAVSIADCRAHTESRRAAGIKDGTIHTRGPSDQTPRVKSFNDITEPA